MILLLGTMFITIVMVVTVREITYKILATKKIKQLSKIIDADPEHRIPEEVLDIINHTFHGAIEITEIEEGLKEDEENKCEDCKDDMDSMYQ